MSAGMRPWAGGLPVRPGPPPSTLAGWRGVALDVATALWAADAEDGTYRLVDTGGRGGGGAPPGTLVAMPHRGPVPPGAAVVGAFLVGHTLGARLTGITVEDLPDDSHEAALETIAHVAAAQGVSLMPTVAVHLLAPVVDIPLSLDDAALVWANIDAETGRPQGTGGRLLGPDSITPFPRSVGGLLRLLCDPELGMFAA